MRVTAGTQVNLRVRIAEVSRTVTKELGFNWESLFNVGAFTFGIATGRDALTAGGTILRSVTGAATLPIGYRSSNGRVDVNTVIDALAKDGLISILAEPNLTALSGETASFLAGGEFPIPVNQRDGQITIEFKQFGVSLDFTPSVLSGERISMKVRPEVSELTDEGAVMIEGLKIPALSVRRAETTVELGSGQSFAVAGLLQNNSRTVIQKVPGISDVPGSRRPVQLHQVPAERDRAGDRRDPLSGDPGVPAGSASGRQRRLCPGAPTWNGSSSVGSTSPASPMQAAFCSAPAASGCAAMSASSWINGSI